MMAMQAKTKTPQKISLPLPVSHPAYNSSTPTAAKAIRNNKMIP